MGNAQYYYLDDSNKPQGPFTVEQMAALMLSGTVTQETKVAAAGDMNWKPVSEQSWMNQEVNGAGASVGFARGGVGVEPGPCPKCGQELTGWSVPVKCPHCGYMLRPATDSFWSNMHFSARHLFTLRGRATRKEYWALNVGMLPIVFLWFILLIADFCYICATGVGESDPMGDMFSVLESWMILFTVTYAILLLPYTFVTGRRLHDIGHSAWWSGLVFALCVGSVYSGVPAMGEYKKLIAEPMKEIATRYEQNESASAEAAVRLAAAAREEGNEELAQEIERKQRESMEQAAVVMKQQMKELELKLCDPRVTVQSRQLMLVTVLNLLSTLCGILLLVLGLIDSKRGPNKYGPSLKYPRG